MTGAMTPPRSSDAVEMVTSRDGDTLSVRVTHDMVMRFAALTGDRSSLHVSDEFARKSAYRRPVVHGMLPVGFLALLPSLHVDGYRCLPMGLTGRFVSPIHADEQLIVRVGRGQIGKAPDDVIFEFQIDSAESGATATLGTLTVTYELADATLVGESPTGAGCMLSTPVEMGNYSLEQIQKGMTDRLDFVISQRVIDDFVDLLASATAENRAAIAGLADRVHLPNLLTVLLFSTSVGVALPGATATFLEFSAAVERRFQLDQPYVLAGEVVHRSAGTRIMKKQLRVTHEGGDAPDLTGRVAVLVAKPNRKMPSVDELRQSATEWGLDGKVVLVTGASRGIGETCAKLFALFGARVIVNYHRGQSDASRVVDEIVTSGGDAVAIGADVTSADEVSRLVDEGIKHFGTVDVLVNNAVRDFRPVPFAKLTWDEVQQDLDVIAKGAFLCCQRVIPQMIQQGGGKIVNVATVAVDDPPPNQLKYVMAKSALVGLTRSLSIEFAAQNIQVNMVVPSFVETDLVAHVTEGFQRRIARDTPMRRNASPMDVARAVLFLASSHSSFTTGQKLMVTGGGAPYL